MSASSPTPACRTRRPRATCGSSRRKSCRSSRGSRSRRPPRRRPPSPPRARTSGRWAFDRRMAFETLLYDAADGIATLTLNRPDRLNAVNATVIRELVAAFDRADADDGVRAFCAGADLGSGPKTFDGRGERPEDHRDGGGVVTLRIFEMTKPVIAAINGPAVGFGITLTLAMDVRLASSAAKIGFVFARRGVVPAARALAREIADNTSAVSVALVRQMLWRMLGAGHPREAHRIDSLGMWHTGRSADAREGITSFLEKRPPRFTGRPSKDMPPFYPWWTGGNDE